MEQGPQGWDGGASPVYLRELLDHWQNRYDWRVEEAMLNRFTHFRADVRGATRLGARIRVLDGGRREVGPDDLSRRTRHLGGQERDVAAARADVEDSHAGDDPGLLEENAREGPEGLGLAAEAVELLGRVPERVRPWRGGLHTIIILGARAVDRAGERT